MKKLAFAISLLCALTSYAEEKIKMNFKNEELPNIIEHYSKASGQKFIIDATVRGKVTLLNSSEVSLEEAFNQLSEALAINGFAIVKTDDMMTVRNARSAQRDNIETNTSLPKAKPQRMTTWIINLKHTSASDVQSSLRLLNSSYGEMNFYASTNQIIISDWSYNLQRIAELIKAIDVPMNPANEKRYAQHLKETAAHRARMEKEMPRPKKGEKPPPPPTSED